MGVQLPRTMSIGIGEGGSVWDTNSHMFQFPLTVSGTFSNFSEGMDSAQLAERHGHELSPTRKAPGMTLGLGFLIDRFIVGPPFVIEVSWRKLLCHKSISGPIFLEPNLDKDDPNR